MTKIEKATLFIELTVEQSATVSGGDSSVNPGVELANQLAALSASGVTVTVTGGTNSNPSSSASPARRSLLPVVSNGVAGNLLP